MRASFWLCAAVLSPLLAIAMPASGAETPKRGGTLTFMIPADAPPSFDGQGTVRNFVRSGAVQLTTPWLV